MDYAGMKKYVFNIITHLNKTYIALKIHSLSPFILNKCKKKKHIFSFRGKCQNIKMLSFRSGTHPGFLLKQGFFWQKKKPWMISCKVNATYFLQYIQINNICFIALSIGEFRYYQVLFLFYKCQVHQFKLSFV